MAKGLLGISLAWLPLMHLAFSASLHSRDYSLEEIQVDESLHDDQFFSFVTRPDLDPPRLNITVYDQDALSPGYLFISPYGIVDQKKHDKAYVGPHIYDAAGELIWSGAAFFKGYDVFDFRVASVDGQDVLTALFPHGNHAIILNNQYEVHSRVDVDVNRKTLNMHAFSVADNGTRALYLKQGRKTASVLESNEVDFEGSCHVQFNGFEERVISTGEVTFQWTSENRIGLGESTLYLDGAPKECSTPSNPWDYLRTYALYKVSGKTGDILWRFGGKKSDFSFDGHFSGQHDAQCHFQNSTHMLISMLDNASGPGWPKETNDFSRGLLVWLNTKTLTAEQLRTIDHPYHEYALGRGNFQTLPNGNGFLSWRGDALETEHTPDGRMIMEASFPSGLKTYRAFKFPWIGSPSAAPDVHAEVLERGPNLVTSVHVSWNGDTQVSYWSLYKVNADASFMQTVDSAQRVGFETALTFQGCAAFVMVAGFDSAGNKLTVSSKISAKGLEMYQQHPSAVQESNWIEAHPDATASLTHPESNGMPNAGKTPTSWNGNQESILENSLVALLLGISIALGVLVSVWLCRQARSKRERAWWRKHALYSALSDESDDEKGSFRLLHPGRKTTPAVVVSGPPD